MPPYSTASVCRLLDGCMSKSCTTQGVAEKTIAPDDVAWNLLLWWDISDRPQHVLSQGTDAHDIWCVTYALSRPGV